MSWLIAPAVIKMTPQAEENTISRWAVLVSVQKRALKEQDYLWREWAWSAGYPDPGLWRQPVVRKPLQFEVFPVLPLPA